MEEKDKETNTEESTTKKLDSDVENLNKLAEDLGLSPQEVNYWLVDHNQINKLAAYDGFQTRYPHWRWGMKYEKRKKKDTYFGGKIFELVNHDNPSNAFLQESNSLQDQRSVIAHVEAHADFFSNNKFFQDEPDAAQMLERHAKIINSYYKDPSIEYEDVESWIDAILCLENTINTLGIMENIEESNNEENDGPSVEDKIDSLDISESVEKQVFRDLEENDDEEIKTDSNNDVLAFLLKHGMKYNDNLERAEEYEDWQRTILEILRKESYYFYPQRMTKIMNEGWAAFWESIMMTDEGYAEKSEIIDYADKQSKVLNAPGLNPYKIGMELWQYIENRSNRKELVEKLLKIDGVTWRNFHSEIDFSEVRMVLDENRDNTVPCERNYSLLRRQNKGFLREISSDELERISRYMFDRSKYQSVNDALKDVNYEAGWEKMREIRETHNDITFIDSFLTSEFIEQEKYFAYEFNPSDEKYEVSGTDLDSVKQKLLLQITNGGKPTIIASDNNYNNSGELLLKHQYNGVPLDIMQANKVLERLFELWGRPVNLKTIDKDLEGNEQGIIIRYDGDKHKEKETDDIDDIRADEIDYDTKPDQWL